MKHTILLLFLILATKLAFSQNVTNIQVEQIGKKVYVTYSLDKTADITLHLSTDGGVTYSEPLKQVTGDVGKAIPMGTHTIVWDVLAERENLKGDNVVFLVKVTSHIFITETVNGVTFEMIYVEGGTFTMGCTSEKESDCDETQKPSHLVTLSDYYIGKFEVTQELWQAVMGSNPSYFKGSNLPVEQVSWDDIQVFIRKLNTLTGQTYRLPIESEWEFAARGGNKSKSFIYAGGNHHIIVKKSTHIIDSLMYTYTIKEQSIDSIAWFELNSDKRTHIVGSKIPNELGIFDMSGNVWEWCQDLFNPYESNQINKSNEIYNGSKRVIRGGYYELPAEGCTVYNRGRYEPNEKGYHIGFRIAIID